LEVRILYYWIKKSERPPSLWLDRDDSGKVGKGEDRSPMTEEKWARYQAEAPPP